VSGSSGGPRLVLYLLPYARWGGPGSLLGNLLRRLERHRALVAIPRGGEGAALLQAAGARVVEVDGLSTLPREWRPWRLGLLLQHQAGTLRRLVCLVRRERPALVHTFSEAMPLGGAVARLSRLPAVCQVIGMSIFQPPAVGLVTSALLGRLYDRLLCAQPVIRDELLARGVRPEKLAVLVNCVEPERIREQASGCSAQPAGRPLVTMVAGMDRRKGHDLLIRAVALLQQRQLPVQLRILGSVGGDPALHAELGELIARLGLQQQVELAGAVPCVPAELARATVHAVPSRSEALSVAGLEAMALGLPVVASRVGGNPFMVVHGETGLLCPPEDPAALAEALASLLGDPPRAKAMGEAGRVRVARLFDAAVVAPLLEKIYDVLGEPGR